METPIDPLTEILANEWLDILPNRAENAILDHAYASLRRLEFLYLGRYEKPLIFKVATREMIPGAK